VVVDEFVIVVAQRRRQLGIELDGLRAAAGQVVTIIGGLTAQCASVIAHQTTIR
jgi:hypothetical protein